MKLRKTNTADRATYAYTFTDTDEHGHSFTVRHTLRPGEDGVTEMDIQLLHRLDDREVESNIRNLRPKKTKAEKAEQAEWAERFKADLQERHGYAPSPDDVKAAIEERFPKNWTRSLDQYQSDDDGGDTSDRHTELADPNAFVDPDEALPPDVQRLREIVATCTAKQREAYRLVYIEGRTETEAAQVMGCTHQAVHKHLDLIKKKIKNNF